jgi:hypothetical protein
VVTETFKQTQAQTRTGYRLINSKFPPIAIFDDVASPDEFESLYALQALTNPRLQNEVGNLALMSTTEIPFSIVGCSYAVAPFVHVNPNGSRFSDGSFGVLYVADTIETAIKEVSHHQLLYWNKVPDIKYERFTFRGLQCVFEDIQCIDATLLDKSHDIYVADDVDYVLPRQFGKQIKSDGFKGIYYHSVRQDNAYCFGLFTPKHVESVIQKKHYEFIYHQQALTINQIRLLESHHEEQINTSLESLS